jgi:Kef-type K+ transport system membrane component KefB
MTSHQAAALLFDLALILTLSHALGVLAARLGQPVVIGEIVAGILIGPTLLGGSISKNLFPLATRPFLSTIANIGVALFMFTAGLELDRTLIRGCGRFVGIISAGSVLFPFSLGITLALFLADHNPTPNRLAFILFVGVAMSVTAFPVLVRILTEKDLHRTTLGMLAVACASVSDVLVWSLLAVVVAMIGLAGGAGFLVLGVVPYFLLMLTVVRRNIARLLRPSVDSEVRTRPRRLVITLVGLLLSGGITESLGLHFIFGAFLFGVIMPRDDTGALQREMAADLGKLMDTLMLPAFFVVAGLQVDLSHVGSEGLLTLILILLTSITGKVFGTFASARICRLQARHSVALSVLMNTRGLTELAVLSVGLQLGILTTQLYSLMVVMAVVTTAITGPLLLLIYPRRSPMRDHFSGNRETLFAARRKA